MTTTKVRELAEALHAELERQETLDDEARAALDALRDDVDRALDGALEEEGGAAPSSRARTLLEKLEAEHPDLTALVQRLADALSAVGL